MSEIDCCDPQNDDSMDDNAFLEDYSYETGDGRDGRDQGDMFDKFIAICCRIKEEGIEAGCFSLNIAGAACSLLKYNSIN